MNRPENGILIVPRVGRLENGHLAVLVWRLTFVDGRFVKKEDLKPDGKWVIVPEGQRHPDECFFEIRPDCIIDRAEEAKKARDWELQSTVEGWEKAKEMGYDST